MAALRTAIRFAVTRLFRVAQYAAYLTSFKAIDLN